MPTGGHDPHMGLLRLRRNAFGCASIARPVGKLVRLICVLDRHRRATIESLIPALSCRRCSPNPPFAKLLGLARLPTHYPDDSEVAIHFERPGRLTVLERGQAAIDHEVGSVDIAAFVRG
jgi:hypothetical protein